MKVIMYHYIKKYDSKFPNFRYLDFDNFKLQLDFFENNYGFVTKYEWNKFIDEGLYPNKKGKVLLTFDDGLDCHYEFVYKELKKRNLWGIFYIPGMPYYENKLLDVHKIHLLTGAFSSQELFQSLRKYLDQDMIPDEKRSDFRNNTYINQRDLSGINNFKRVLNYYISYEHRTKIIEKIAKDLDYFFDAEDFYLKDNHLHEMINNGMILGAHSYSHPVMSKLSLDEQKFEIKKSLDIFQLLGIKTTNTYCHPYGGFHSFNKDTLKVLNQESVRYSFNVEAREINHLDFSISIQFLPRFDCNMFPFGKTS